MRLNLIASVFAALVLLIGTGEASELRGTLAKIKKSGVITVGHRDDAVPYSYLDEKQVPVGYSIDVCREIIKQISKVVGREVKVQYLSANSQTRIPLFANGTIDLDCGNAFQTIARMRQVDYSIPIYFSSERFLVMKQSAINDIDDLKGKKVAVIQGTSADKFFTDRVASQKVDIGLLRVREISDGFMALSTGRVDALTSDDVMLNSMIQRYPEGKDMHVVGKPYEVSPLGLLLRQDDSQFRLVVDAALSSQIASGELSKMMDKWFTSIGVTPDPAQQSAFRFIAIPD